MKLVKYIEPETKGDIGTSVTRYGIEWEDIMYPSIEWSYGWCVSNIQVLDIEDNVLYSFEDALANDHIELSIDCKYISTHKDFIIIKKICGEDNI